MLPFQHDGGAVGDVTDIAFAVHGTSSIDAHVVISIVIRGIFRCENKSEKEEQENERKGKELR